MVVYTFVHTQPSRTLGRVGLRMSALAVILRPRTHGRGFMQYLLFGGLMAVLGLLWAVLSLHDDPLEEAIRQANAWEKDQMKLRKVMPQ